MKMRKIWVNFVMIPVNLVKGGKFFCSNRKYKCPVFNALVQMMRR